MSMAGGEGEGRVASPPALPCSALVLPSCPCLPSPNSLQPVPRCAAGVWLEEGGEEAWCGGREGAHPGVGSAHKIFT